MNTWYKILYALRLRKRPRYKFVSTDEWNGIMKRIGL